MQQRKRFAWGPWRSRLILMMGIVAVCGFTLAACGSDGSSTSSTSGTSGGATESGGASDATESSDASGIAETKEEVAELEQPPTTVGTTAPLKEAPPKGKTIVAMACAGLPPCELYLSQFKEAADALGWKAITVPFEPTPEEILNKMKYAMGLHPDGIVINGVSRATFASALKEDESVPVIQQDIDDEPSPPVIAVQNGTKEFEKFGSILGKWAVADSDGDVNAVLFTYSIFPIGQTLIKSAASTIESLCESCSAKVVTVPATATATELPSRVVSEVQSNPDANYVLFQDGGMSAGVEAALKAAGLGDQVALAGAIPDAQALADLNDGTQKAYVNLPLGQQAWQAMDGFARDFTKTPQPPWEIPAQILVKGNFTGSTHVEPPEYQQAFKKLWLVE